MHAAHSPPFSTSQPNSIEESSRLARDPHHDPEEDYRNPGRLVASDARVLKIDWSRNSVSSMEVISSFPRLIHLILSSNNIRKISGLSNSRMLEILNLSYNHIHSIEGLESTTRLKVLNLSNNELESLKGFERCIALETLDLSFNKIKVFQDELLKLSSLKTLLLTQNNLHELGYLRVNSRLEVLDLRHNKLKTIREAHHLLPDSLRILLLGNNRIEDLLIPIELAFLRLRSLDLSGNPVIPDLRRHGIAYRPYVLSLLGHHLLELDFVQVRESEAKNILTIIGDRDTFVLRVTKMLPRARENISQLLGLLNRHFPIPPSLHNRGSSGPTKTPEHVPNILQTPRSTFVSPAKPSRRTTPTETPQPRTAPNTGSRVQVGHFTHLMDQTGGGTPPVWIRTQEQPVTTLIHYMEFLNMKRELDHIKYLLKYMIIEGKDHILRRMEPHEVGDLGHLVERLKNKELSKIGLRRRKMILRTIQIRTSSHRAEAIYLPIHEMIPIIKIQAAARGFLVRMRLANYRKNEAAAIKIQSIWRGILTRRRIRARFIGSSNTGVSALQNQVRLLNRILTDVSRQVNALRK